VGTSRSIWPAIYPELLDLIQAHRSTIVFVNARRAAERLAMRLNELAAERRAGGARHAGMLCIEVGEVWAARTASGIEPGPAGDLRIRRGQPGDATRVARERRLIEEDEIAATR
jgi:ATP-dependent Lhr-like helicase